MVIHRGAIYWADHDGGRKPVLVVQAQAYNDSRLPTVLAVALTSNTKAATMPGNVCSWPLRRPACRATRWSTSRSW